MMWICCQRGAREHYNLPRALQNCGRLELLMTEFYATERIRALAKMLRWRPLMRMATRYNRHIDEKLVKSWNLPALWRLALKHNQSKYDHYLIENRWLANRCINHLQGRHHDMRSFVIFSYTGTALELFQWAKARGARCILGQIDPGKVEQDLVKEERRQWPGWDLYNDEIPEAYNQRCHEEWELADIIIVNSKWSFKAMLQQGVPEKKLRIIPLCYEPIGAVNQNDYQRRREEKLRKTGCLKVLFLGQVILRKGIQYLIEAAKKTPGENIIYHVVGPIGITKQALASAPVNMIFHGPVSRQDAAKWYMESDVFVLPTISDGFAITQVEAMHYGLPVIATPNCGEVVRHGLDGYVVPIRDSTEIALAIMNYVVSAGHLRESSKNAKRHAREFNINKLAADITNLEDELIN